MYEQSKLREGRQLKLARVGLGLTLNEVAALARINRNSVLRAESLAVLPRFAYAASKIGNLFSSLGVSFDANDQSVSVLFPINKND